MSWPKGALSNRLELSAQLEGENKSSEAGIRVHEHRTGLEVVTLLKSLPHHHQSRPVVVKVELVI